MQKPESLIDQRFYQPLTEILWPFMLWSCIKRTHCNFNQGNRYTRSILSLASNLSCLTVVYDKRETPLKPSNKRINRGKKTVFQQRFGSGTVKEGRKSGLFFLPGFQLSAFALVVSKATWQPDVSCCSRRSFSSLERSVSLSLVWAGSTDTYSPTYSLHLRVLALSKRIRTRAAAVIQRLSVAGTCYILVDGWYLTNPEISGNVINDTEHVLWSKSPVNGMIPLALWFLYTF